MSWELLKVSEIWEIAKFGVLLSTNDYFEQLQNPWCILIFLSFEMKSD